jgi:16S rRNA (cytidine1402-2'-O)-methyltransferase
MAIKQGTGILYLIPSTLGDTPPEKVLPQETLTVIRALNQFIVEEVRTARRFLRAAGVTRNLDELTFHIFNEHSDKNSAETYLESLLQGTDTGLLSEAGTPCIADPGAEIVAAAHRNGIRVVPLTGPSSILLALIASGLGGQQFAFHGYLPVDKAGRTKKIRELERESAEKGQTQIFIETPYRNRQMIESLALTCRPDTLICIAVDLTTDHQMVLLRTAGEWRESLPDIHKRPAVFLLSRGNSPL